MLSILGLHSGYYYALFSSSYNDDEILLLDVEEENLETHKKKIHVIDEPVAPCKEFVCYPYLNHIDATFYVLQNNKGKFTFMKTMDWKKFETLVEFNNKYDNIKSVIYVANKFVFFIQHKHCYKINIYDLCSKTMKKSFDINHSLCNPNRVCHIQPLLPHGQLINNNQFIFQEMSFTKYGDTYSMRFDINNDVLFEKYKVKKNMARKYNNICNEKTLYLDNNNIMITILYKKGTKLNNRKCLVYGYGCYGDSYESTFNFNNIMEFCDLGFIVVISHISGDNKLGYGQYLNGIREKKKNSMHDIIYICDYLVSHGITKREKLALWGRSAGGLLMGSVINMRPDLCELAILGVPFLTPLETMKSKKNPLGFETHSELGDPRQKDMQAYIESYSPVDNIKQCAQYPNIFIYANLNDTLTPYKETVQYVEKMEKVDVFENKSRELLVYLDDKFGHKQGSKLCDQHYVFALIMSALQKFIKD
jgi:protease II